MVKNRDWLTAVITADRSTRTQFRYLVQFCGFLRIRNTNLRQYYGFIFRLTKAVPNIKCFSNALVYFSFVYEGIRSRLKVMIRALVLSRAFGYVRQEYLWCEPSLERGITVFEWRGPDHFWSLTLPTAITNFVIWRDSHQKNHKQHVIRQRTDHLMISPHRL